jgi:8-oxo-dGTP pyrophosphatase MutT (NUDIX family)
MQATMPSYSRTVPRWVSVSYQAAWKVRLAIARQLNQNLHGSQVAVIYKQHVLMIRNSYRDGLYLPGGNSPARESNVSTAVRELREEVALHVQVKELNTAGQFSYKINGTTIKDEIFISEPKSIDQLTGDGREIVDILLLDHKDLEKNVYEIQPHIYQLLRQLTVSPTN